MSDISQDPSYSSIHWPRWILPESLLGRVSLDTAPPLASEEPFLGMCGPGRPPDFGEKYVVWAGPSLLFLIALIFLFLRILVSGEWISSSFTLGNEGGYPPPAWVYLWLRWPVVSRIRVWNRFVVFTISDDMTRIFIRIYIYDRHTQRNTHNGNYHIYKHYMFSVSINMPSNLDKPILIYLVGQ